MAAPRPSLQRLPASVRKCAPRFAVVLAGAVVLLLGASSRLLGRSFVGNLRRCSPQRGELCARGVSTVAQDTFYSGLKLINQGRAPRDDLAKGINLVKQAADEGNTEARNTVGLMFLQGIMGVPRDIPEASHYLQMAADDGHMNAAFNLGLMKLKGDGVTQNKFEAAKLFRQAAEEGHEDAAVNLATMLVKGDGIPKDMQLGAQWLIKICQRGNRWNELMEMIESGNLDPDTASELTEKIEELKEFYRQNPQINLYEQNKGLR